MRVGACNAFCDTCTHTQRIGAKLLQVGDIVEVRLGERVPCDGIVRNGGAALLDQSQVLVLVGSCVRVRVFRQHVYMYDAFMHACMHAYVHVCTYRTCIHACMRACMHVCVCVCVCV